MLIEVPKVNREKVNQIKSKMKQTNNTVNIAKEYI
jgi:hypothetical protein